MRNINKRGFTLVELLVAITILGIIMVIALPQLTGLKNDNAETKYEKYSDSVVTSAKLYTDSYAKDMFGNNTSGCYDIPYKKLEEKNLAKDIKVDDLTCDTYNGTTPTTFVRVYKSQDVYLYDIAIKCVDKNNKVVYEKTLNGDICNGKTSDETGPTIEISGIENDWTTGRDSSNNPLKATIIVKDAYGLKENVSIQYAWTKNTSNLNSLEYKTKTFTNSREEAKTELSFEIDYPQNENDYWYLVVKPGSDGLRDLNGNYSDSSPIQAGPIKLDNTKPVITNLANSKDGVWINQPVTVSGTISDAHSGVKKIYYSYKADGSAKTEFGTGQITSGGTGPFNVSKQWTTNTNESVYIIGEDAVGNITEIMSAGKVMVDTVNPTLTWEVSPGTYQNNNGITVISKCTDAFSGVKITSPSTNVSSPTTSSGQDITHTCTDNAGNPATLTGNYKVKINSRHQECGVESYKSCATEACGIESYNSCATPECGIKSYNTCRNSACGYASCATSACGYKSCASSACGCKSWDYNGSSRCNGKPPAGPKITPISGSGYSSESSALLACETNSAGCNGIYQNACTTPCGSYKTCTTSSCGTNSCQNSACGYATCTTSGCGVKEYKSCRAAPCGVESYISCRTPECGVERYKECWHY